MLREYTDRYVENKENIIKKIEKDKPCSYEGILTIAIEFIANDEYNELKKDNKIHTIDDGDYQGTLLFIMPANTYQPYKYFWTMVAYGSCSGCDTIQRTLDDYGYGEERDWNKVAEEFYILGLHMIQNMKILE